MSHHASYIHLLQCCRANLGTTLLLTNTLSQLLHATAHHLFHKPHPKYFLNLLHISHHFLSLAYLTIHQACQHIRYSIGHRCLHHNSIPKPLYIHHIYTPLNYHHNNQLIIVFSNSRHYPTQIHDTILLYFLYSLHKYIINNLVLPPDPKFITSSKTTYSRVASTHLITM